MPTLTVETTLWRDLEIAARKQRLSAEKLAARALSEYLQRIEDEELLRQSSRAARQSRFSITESEEAVRRHRARKARQPLQQ